jgi:hypothetical protein|tara:strand:- start:13 stop:336 length:324 start_codon:yes stop_codon:yes gene_type:complete
MSNQKNFAAEFNHLPDTGHLKKITLSNIDSKQNHSVDNIPGKQASVKILYSIALDNNFKISATQAEAGIILFGDYTAEEKQQPNAHPNIRLLLDIIEHNQTWEVEVV